MIVDSITRAQTMRVPGVGRVWFRALRPLRPVVSHPASSSSCARSAPLTDASELSSRNLCSPWRRSLLELSFRSPRADVAAFSRERDRIGRDLHDFSPISPQPAWH